MNAFELRRARPEDATAIHTIRSLPETRRYQPLVPGSVDRVQQALTERGSAPLVPTQAGKLQWTIDVAGEPAGWITIDVTSREHHIASLGYALHPRHHGQGIMRAAVMQVMPIVFDARQLAIERLEAVAAVDNLGSRRVLETSGFAFEGVARGYLIISGKRVDHARYVRLLDR